MNINENEVEFYEIIDDGATTFSTPNINISSDPVDDMVEQPTFTKTTESTNKY